MKLLVLCALLVGTLAKPMSGTLFKMSDSLHFDVVDAIPKHAVPASRRDMYETLMRPVGSDREPDFSKKVLISKDDRLPFLKELLNLATKVEMLTYQPYLTARYSIPPEVDTVSDDIRLLLRQVSVQEMLHVGLAMNILIAVGGIPTLWTGEQDAPNYNYPLMDLFNDCDERNYEILPASQFQLKQFFRIESERIRVPVEIDGMPFVYRGISEFYRDVDRLLVDVETDAQQLGGTIFLNQDRNAQIGKQFNPDTAYFFQANSFIIVTDLDTALEATNLITWQGEAAGIPVMGLDGPSHAEMFFRGMVEIYNSPIVTYTFPPQEEVLMDPLLRSLLKAQIIGYNLIPLTVEKIGQVNEMTDEGAALKRMLMASNRDDPSNLSYLMMFYSEIGEFLASRGVLMQFPFYRFDPAVTPKRELLQALKTAEQDARSQGDNSALMKIQMWQMEVEMQLLVDFPLVGAPMAPPEPPVFSIAQH